MRERKEKKRKYEEEWNEGVSETQKKLMPPPPSPLDPVRLLFWYTKYYTCVYLLIPVPKETDSVYSLLLVSSNHNFIYSTLYATPRPLPSWYLHHLPFLPLPSSPLSYFPCFSNHSFPFLPLPSLTFLASPIFPILLPAGVSSSSLLLTITSEF